MMSIDRIRLRDPGARRRATLSFLALTLVISAGVLAGGCADRSAERQQQYVRPEGPPVRTLDVRLGASDRRDRVEIRPGETLVVRLEAQAREGFRWELATDEWDTRVLELLDRPGVPPEVAGAAATADPRPTRWDVFSFRGIAPGSVTVRFHHLQPLDADPQPTERYGVTVEVERDR